MQTTRYCLDSDWRFTPSPQSVLPKMLTHETTYAFTKGNGAVGPAALNFDDGAWETVSLPHDWQHTTPFDLTGIASHGYHPSGVCWYRRTFLLDEADADYEIQLVFEGISGVSDVYFNGAKLKHNESCYNGFCLPLTDIANFGATPNVLAVRVDKTVWEGWWYEGCGINRHVWLIKRPRLHVVHDGLWVKPVKGADGKWCAELEITVHNASTLAASGTVQAVIQSPSGDEAARATLSLSTDAYGYECLNATCALASPELWTLEHPALYTLLVTLHGAQGIDTAQARFGLRTIRVDAEAGFFLNDEPVKLLGTCNHQDHAGIGAAIPRDLWRYRLQLLKDMGSNAYRCSHNPPPPELLDLCDEMGMLVMDENRSYSSTEEALELLRSMVRRDRNHPCVIMYSLFNEEPWQGTQKGRRIAQHQMAELKKLDDTRPVLGAFNGGFFEPSGAGTCMDITGINYFTDSYDAFHKRYPAQPVVSTEIASAFATRGQCETDIDTQVFGNYDEDCAPWGETARDANTAVLSRPFVMGMFVWTGFDYRGEPTPYEWPSVSSHFGIMDLCGFPKDVYYLYQSFWLTRPVLHLFPHWNHTALKRVRVMAYTNLPQVELLLNGKSLGTKAASPANPPEWLVDYEPGTLEAVGYRDNRRVLTAVRTTAGTPARLVLTSPMPCLYRDSDSVAAITLMAQDAQGRECPTAKCRTSVTVEGGTLLGFGNGDPNCHDPDVTANCRLFNGRCQLIVAADHAAQQVVVRATARGMQAGELALPIQTRPFPASLPMTDVRLLDDWRVTHAPLAERPDPTQTLGANDMNSMEPVSFDGVPLSSLDGCDGMYCMYQAKADIATADNTRHIIINRVRGDVELYVNNKRLFGKSCPTDERLEIPLPDTLHGLCRLSIILKNRTVDKRAGILDPITLIVAPKGGHHHDHPALRP